MTGRAGSGSRAGATVLRPPTSATFEAIGTTCQVLVTDPDALAEAVRIVRGHLDVLDRAVSRFRADSELSRLAAAAVDGPASAEVSSTALEYVSVALRAAEHTDGLVDPTVGAAVVASGYDADLATVRARDAVARMPVGAPVLAPAGMPPRAVPGWRSVTVNRVTRTIFVPQGMVLDLGSTAKAHAADVTARLLLDRLPGGFVVNLGGDLAISGCPPRGGWRVGVEALDGSVAEVVTTTMLCLATSSTVRRTWTIPTASTTGRGSDDGRPGGSGPDGRGSDGRGPGRGIRHHIVDPRTGDTAVSPWATVTCAAPTTLEANTDATAAVVLGHDAPAWLEARGLAARLADPAGRVTTTRGWPTHREVVPA